MKWSDVVDFSFKSLKGHTVRSLLVLTAMAIGVGAVVVLTSLGEGARRYITGEFASLGTHLLAVLPGRSETTGGHPPILGETPRDLTLDDALALLRSRHIRRMAPVSVGSAPVSWQQKEREVTVMGSTASFQTIRHLKVAQGRFLPETDPREAQMVCVLGAKLSRELFGSQSPLGQWVRVGDRRFRVVGVLASEGRSIGVDLGDMVVVPVASAQALFDAPSLFRILAEARTREVLPQAAEDIRRIIRERHEGEEDVTVITQDAVVATFDRIFRVLTLTVAAIAAISLVVAGILIMNVMLIAVSQRTEEIGLLKSLGAPASRIQILFLSEAGLLSIVGAALGLGIGLLGVAIGRALYPSLPLAPPLWALAAALAVALVMGILFGLLPARRAANLDPVQALSRR